MVNCIGDRSLLLELSFENPCGLKVGAEPVYSNCIGGGRYIRVGLKSSQSATSTKFDPALR